MANDETPPDAAGCCRPAGDVCSLPEDQLGDRIELIRNELLPRATARRDLPNGFEWDFAACDTLRERLGAFVAFERECCGGLDWRVGEKAGVLTLHVSGPGAREAFAGLARDAAERPPARGAGAAESASRGPAGRIP